MYTFWEKDDTRWRRCYTISIFHFAYWVNFQEFIIFIILFIQTICNKLVQHLYLKSFFTNHNLLFRSLLLFPLWSYSFTPTHGCAGLYRMGINYKFISSTPSLLRHTRWGHELGSWSGHGVKQDKRHVLPRFSTIMACTRNTVTKTKITLLIFIREITLGKKVVLYSLCMVFIQILHDTQKL